MYLTNTGLFRARWSNQIHDEWIGGLKFESQHVDVTP